MASKMDSPGEPKSQLSLFDSTCIIVGIIIGSGIYKTTPLIAANVAGAGSLIWIWIFGGLISLVGALCYAELSTSFPREGGNYAFLTEAFGRRTGFIYAWAEYWIIRPGNIGLLAFVYAQYADRLFPLPVSWGPQVVLITHACLAIAVLTVLNLIGVKSGKWTQNVLTVVKVIGLAAIFVCAFAFVPDTKSSLAENPSGGGNFQLAIILVLFTYGGWNEMSCVAAEVREPRKNLFRALLLGTGAVTLIYVLVNLAFVRMLGFEEMGKAGAIAADAFAPFGVMASRGMSLLVCLSCLGSMSGMIFTGARIYYSLGREHRMFAWLGEWSEKYDSPIRALSIQIAVTIGLIVGFGWYQNGFDNLIKFTSPVFWFFMFMAGVSLFILRFKKPDMKEPYRVPFYPWIPIVFCLMCGFLFDSSFSYAMQNGSQEAYWALGLLIAGWALSYATPD